LIQLIAMVTSSNRCTRFSLVDHLLWIHRP